MKKLIKWFKWFDNNLIKTLVIGFIFLIPLYPKIPLKTVTFTYIAIRLEDLYLAILVGFFILQLIRKKIILNTKFLKLFILFWISVFISYLLGVFWLKTIDYPFVGFLHALRRVEYMILFFIAGSTIKSKKDFQHLLNAFLVSLTLVNLYALGQKFLGFPAIQTMNPEFAKGRILYLTPEARISSTFAGHYDLAAYLVLLIPVTLSVFFYRQSKKIFLLFILSLSILILTASRISFIAYIVSTLLFLLFLRKYSYAVFVLLLSVALMFTTKDLIKRFSKTLQIKQILVNEKTGEAYIPQTITVDELPAGSAFIKLNGKKQKETTNVKAYRKKILRQKTLIEATKSGKILTASQQARLQATLSAEIKPIKTIVSDISFATRLQIEWPRAVQSFIKNPLFGSGASSITEATDNDYLRSLGEIGFIGSALFGYLILSLMYFIWKKAIKIKNSFDLVLYGLLFGIFGLLINASYIDVFEASKVAYTFWMLMGIFISYLQLSKTKKRL